jgi:hypothetical protein
MKFENYKKLINNFTKKLNQIDVNSFLENIKNLKIDDLKNINYKRLFYDIRNSQYLKPSVGILSASLLTILLLLPAIEKINSSFKKAKKYKLESENLPTKINELKNKSLKFKEIKIKMDEINSSFLKNQQILFIAQLLNETSKKTNVNINYFSPIFKADSSKLCKSSTYQKKSKNFKSVKKKPNPAKKGYLKDNYFEVTLKSDYLDIVEFLKELQLYDVMLIPFCLEINSQEIVVTSSSEKSKDKDSIIIPLNKEGVPLVSYDEIDNINKNPDLGKVETKIVFKIPSFNK